MTDNDEHRADMQFAQHELEEAVRHHTLATERLAKARATLAMLIERSSKRSQENP